MATTGGRHAGEASGSADQAYELFRAALLSVVPDGDPPPALGPEVDSVVVNRTIRNQAGVVTGYEFLIDGFPYRFPSAAGKLLKALCEDREGVRGRYVSFKSQASLERSLGVSTTWLHTQVNRLRDILEKRHGFSRKLVETDRAEGYRFRLVRERVRDASEGK
ncbi:MAG: hypothetical protein GWO24_16425 [Akkermansiaceae bacterium]|nr:hypothetical protein [Akkermansiaceae bacterium]